ncbi:high mobility group B protein 10 [Daucus carota subsp. sativus]|uniref:high mobility group B protein 10 n=1 Tax=Daucus carota subsp. sativus TaxID=79200 RepID=UPI0007EF6E09|nr:PREDICTED: high mobility group B protein 10-like [Daucus carota subsp. sativus]
MSTTHEPVTPGNAATSLSPPLSHPPPDAEYDELVQNQELFREKLEKFHQFKRTKIKIPTIGGRPLDLHRLFVEVTGRGGMDKVINDRKWKEVFQGFNCPTTITGASYALRSHYQSLLYDFEQVYYFRNSAPSVIDNDSASTIVNGSSALSLFEDSASMHPLPSGSSIMEPGSLLNGMLVAKCELGYMVTVDVGREQWKGILYHNPSGSESLNDSDQNHTVICRSQNELWDPARFEENGVGYKYFHAEIWEKLKRFYGNEEDGMNKKIWLIWNRKSEAEKQVYHMKG